MDLGSVYIILLFLLCCFALFAFLSIGKSKKRKCPKCKMEIDESVVSCKHCKNIVDFTPNQSKILGYLHKQTDKQFLVYKSEDKNKRQNLKK